MDNSKTQYACGICEKDFFNPNSLVKHVELRHQLSARQSSTYSNINRTPTTKSCSDHQGNSLNTKSNNDMDRFELVATNGIEIDTNGTEISSHDKSNLSESSNISNIQNDSASSKDDTIDIQIKYLCMICCKTFFQKDSFDQHT